MTRKTNLRRIIHATLHKSEDVYVGECVEVAVATQGRTLARVVANLEEAVALYFEEENMSAMGFSKHPRLRITLEVPIKL
jgi:predicted RNase H-like HicB family nuclease